RAGRLEEAYRLLGQPVAQGHKRAGDMLRVVSRKFVERGKNRLSHGDTEAAWHDLQMAEQMERADHDAGQLRQDLIQAGMSEAKTLLQAGEPGRAGETLAQLRERGVRSAALQLLEEAAKGWLSARELAARGEFAQAHDVFQRIRRLVPEPSGALLAFGREIEQHQQTFSGLLVQLHRAVEGARWHEVVNVSEQILAAAPHHQEALKARGRAWKAIEPATVVGTKPGKEREEEPPAFLPAQRYLLWIDGVGGFLVCMGPRITLGQATTDGYVDLPLYADVSRHHATITRDGEGYLLEAVRPVQVNAKSIEKVLLRPNDRVTLGASCQLQFRQPVAVSTSARLDITSGHRLPLALDAVLLMADTLILGPGTQSHVMLPDLKHPVILYRHKAGLGVRHAGNLIVDGRQVKDRAVLGSTASVTGDDFAMAIESVGNRMGRL
ncbi:MAG TPA: FHA domain-containing protein, partial [Gemmataceae bacterium]|nr:FHA domain-containing protein [Gemmataceae bacterium]